MYEVADKFEKRATDISNQITDLQNQLRKYYIDAYLDIQSRELADDHDEDNESRKQHAAIPNNNAEPAQKQLEQKDDGSVLITSPMDMRERLVNRLVNLQLEDEDASPVLRHDVGTYCNVLMTSCSVLGSGGNSRQYVDLSHSSPSEPSSLVHIQVR